MGDTTVTFTKGIQRTQAITPLRFYPPVMGVKGAKTPPPAGIVTGALTGAINANTGAIDASKLNKSGNLVGKNRPCKAKGGLPALIDYENITVSKQQVGAGTDVTTIPTISPFSGDDFKWKTGNPATTVWYLAYINLPGGSKC